MNRFNSSTMVSSSKRLVLYSTFILIALPLFWKYHICSYFDVVDGSSIRLISPVRFLIFKFTKSGTFKEYFVLKIECCMITVCKAVQNFFSSNNVCFIRNITGSLYCERPSASNSFIKISLCCCGDKAMFILRHRITISFSSAVLFSVVSLLSKFQSNLYINFQYSHANCHKFHLEFIKNN
uniref:Transmembrane protein n=1 Tax=Heterorhabditis bacteriophora TaxID=37862 RepID=A0A1I7WU89_HETBA